MSTLISVKSVLALVAASPLLALACGGGQPAPAVVPPTTAASASSGNVLVTNSNPSPSAMPSDAPSATTPAPPPPSSSALAAILTVDPSQVSTLARAVSTAPAPKMKTAGEVKDLARGLAEVASKRAPDLKPDGSIATGTLKEGDHLAWSITLPPGKCYAVVGYSPTGEVADLDLRIFEPPFYGSITGEDESDDNTPVVGGGPNPMCPVAASPLPYKVDITSQKGTGHAAVQLFAKTK